MSIKLARTQPEIRRRLAEKSVGRINSAVIADLLGLLNRGGAAEVSPFLCEDIIMSLLDGLAVRGVAAVRQHCIEMSDGWQSVQLVSLEAENDGQIITATLADHVGKSAGACRSRFVLAGFQVKRWYELPRR